MGRLFAFWKFLVDNILGMLLHTPHDESDASSLTRLASERNNHTIAKALKRFEALGILMSRQFETLTLYRLDPTWTANGEIRELLKAMGRAWPEYAEVEQSNPPCSRPIAWPSKEGELL